MILMGDEYGHSKVCKAAMAEMGSCQTNGVSPAHEYLDAKAFPLKSDTEIVGLTWQGGNNNTYCHDSPLNWQNWAQAEADRKGLRRFVSHFVKCGGPPDWPSCMCGSASGC